MPIQLKRQVVAEKYRALTDEDPTIHVGCYSGKLSDINECGAAALVKSQSPYLEVISATDEEENP